MVDALSILSDRFTVPAKGRISSNFWVALGFNAIKGVANADKVNDDSLLRITQAVDPSKSDRVRTIKMFDPECDVKIIEPVCSKFVKVEYENGLDEEVSVSIDVSLKKERVERGELRFRDFYNATTTAAATSDFPDNVVDIQAVLGRPVNALEIKLPNPTDTVEIKINDLGSNPFTVIGEKKFTPEEEQLEICRLFIKNSGGAIDVKIFGA